MAHESIVSLNAVSRIRKKKRKEKRKKTVKRKRRRKETRKKMRKGKGKEKRERDIGNTDRNEMVLYFLSRPFTLLRRRSETQSVLPRQVKWKE